MKTDYLESAIKQFEYYKMLGEKTIARIPDDKLSWQYNAESNSVATIVKHLHGNMLSRWTDFLTSDGEKPWRERDAEFDNDVPSRASIEKLWNEGWDCTFNALRPLTDDDLGKIVYIRNQGHTVTEAINRQLAHYPYHIGQIVFIGKMLLDNNWETLSIARGKSTDFNADKFSRDRHKAHFTDEFLSDSNEKQ